MKSPAAHRRFSSANAVCALAVVFGAAACLVEIPALERVPAAEDAGAEPRDAEPPIDETIESDSNDCGPCVLPHATAACIAGSCSIESCNPGWHDCDDIASTGCETDLETAPDDCGQCGHTCRGSACEQGRCKPELLAANQDGPFDLAIDLERVYWTTYVGGTVCSIGKDATGFDVLSSDLEQPWFIALDATRVIWANRSGQRIDAIPKEGGATEPFVSSELVKPTAIEVDGFSVFWTDANKGVVERVNRLDGADRRLLAEGLPYPWKLAALEGGSPLYFTNKQPGAIYRVHKWGDTPHELVADGWFNVAGIALDMDALYSIDDDGAGSGYVRRIELADAGAPQELAALDGTPNDIIVSEGVLYVAMPDEGRILSVPVTGGQANVRDLVMSLSDPFALAADDDFVYWVDRTGGGVWKVAK